MGFDIHAPTEEDRIWAGLGYAGSVFFFCGLPVFLIFMFKKDESFYLRFHTFQGLIFSILWLGLFVLTLWLTFITHAAMSIAFFLFLSPVILWAFLIIQGFMGKNFQLPGIGALISRFIRPL